MQNHEKFRDLERIKDAFAKRVTATVGIESEPIPGTIWEVEAPSGELLELVVVERFDNAKQPPFPFVRAVPLTDFVRLTDDGDAIVTIEPSMEVLAAHCWLEGPVLTSSLVRCVGRIPLNCMDDLEAARKSGESISVNEAVKLFREDLLEQFDQVFSDTWREFYAKVGQEENDENAGINDSGGNSTAVIVGPWELLRQRQQELAGATDSLAADWANDSSPIAKELFSYRASIEGDNVVKIRFDTKLSSQGTAQLVINLVGGRAHTEKYQSVILRVADGSETREPIIDRTAVFHVSANVLNSSTQLLVVDIDGRTNAVLT